MQPTRLGDVMHAVLVNVKISPGRREESLSALHGHIVPMCKGASGFVRGTWFGDEEFGNSLMMFDSEASARAMAEQVRSDPGDPVQVTGVQVYEVHAEA